MDSEFLILGIWAPSFFGHTEFEVKNLSEFFHLQNAVDSEFLRLGVWAPNFFGNAKFEVKNFSKFFNLQRTVDSEFFERGVLAQTGHTKFEVKIFFGFV